MIAIFAAPILWWRGRHGLQSKEALGAIGFFVALAGGFVFFEAIQRVPALSAVWLAGSYGIRIWLVSGLVSLTALLAGAFIAKRSKAVLATLVLTIVFSLGWFCLLVPDRAESSRLNFRWIFWVSTCVGVLLGFSKSRWRMPLLCLSLIVGGVATAWCLYIVVFAYGHAFAGFWIIAGAISMCMAALTLALCVDARRQSIPTIPGRTDYGSIAAAAALVIAAGLVFWKANYRGLESGMRLDVICVDLNSGERVWQSGYSSAMFSSPHYANSYASPTPVIEGNHVYAYFGTAGAACFDLDGRKLWIHESLPLETPYGAGSSPILHENKMIIACDSDTESYVIALKCDSGEVAWKTKRNSSRGSFGTPTLATIEGKTQMIVAGGGVVAGYDPSNGEQLWESTLPMTEVVASSIAINNLLFVSSESRLIAYMVKQDANEILWETQDDAPTVASPIVTDSHVIMLSDSGMLTCLDRTDGKLVRNLDLDQGAYFSSPVLCGDRILVCSRSGVVTIVRMSDLTAMAELKLGEDCFASPAVCDDGVVLRASQSLLKFGPVAKGAGTTRASLHLPEKMGRGKNVVPAVTERMFHRVEVQ